MPLNTYRKCNIFPFSIYCFCPCFCQHQWSRKFGKHFKKKTWLGNVCLWKKTWIINEEVADASWKHNIPESNSETKWVKPVSHYNRKITKHLCEPLLFLLTYKRHSSRYKGYAEMLGLVRAIPLIFTTKTLRFIHYIFSELNLKICYSATSVDLPSSSKPAFTTPSVWSLLDDIVRPYDRSDRSIPATAPALIIWIFIPQIWGRSSKYQQW